MKPKFKLGDRVCVSKYKRTFEEGYTPNWTEEVFIIYGTQLFEPNRLHIKRTERGIYILKKHLGDFSGDRLRLLRNLRWSCTQFQTYMLKILYFWCKDESISSSTKRRSSEKQTQFLVGRVGCKYHLTEENNEIKMQQLNQYCNATVKICTYIKIDHLSRVNTC